MRTWPSILHAECFDIRFTIVYNPRYKGKTVFADATSLAETIDTTRVVAETDTLVGRMKMGQYPLPLRFLGNRLGRADPALWNPGR